MLKRTSFYREYAFERKEKTLPLLMFNPMLNPVVLKQNRLKPLN